MYVCLLAYPESHMSKLHDIFCMCYLWPWLSPTLTTVVQCVMYFHFVNQRTLCLVEFTRWQHQCQPHRAHGCKVCSPLLGLVTVDCIDLSLDLRLDAGDLRLRSAQAAITFHQACGYLPSRRASPPLGR